MIISCISDTHNTHRLIDEGSLEGDVIIHSGDFTNIGKKNRSDDFLEWYASLDFTYKILIAGNHDLHAEEKRDEFINSIPDNIIYLENEHTVINGIKIWGSPVTPVFHNWAFNYERGHEIRKVWEKIPADTDIIVTHGPPHGIKDEINTPLYLGEYPYKGCEELKTRVEEIEPKIHLFGHIHESRGLYHDKHTDIAYINASIVDQFEQPKNRPIKVFLDEQTKNCELIEY